MAGTWPANMSTSASFAPRTISGWSASCLITPARDSVPMANGSPWFRPMACCCANRYKNICRPCRSGSSRRIGRGQWVPTSGQRGSADISATINGRSVKIEVKMKDKQSPAQREYQAAIEQAGGVYLIVRNFEEFHNWFLVYNAGAKTATAGRPTPESRGQ